MDQSIFQKINGLAGQSALLDILGIFLAQYLAYFLMVGFLIGLIFVRNWKTRFYQFALVALSVIIARGLIAELIRFLYYRPRPYLVFPIEALVQPSSAASLPSGHAAVFFALGVAVFYLNKKWGLFILISALAMGLARIFIGVHWPSDILWGAIVGVFGAVVSHWILKDTLRKISNQ